MASVLVIVALISALTAMQLAVHGHEVKIPDFRNETPAEARNAAEQAGLEAQVEREYYSAAVPAGKILSQMPEPGSIVRRGWQVRLALSLGPQRVTIPQVVGESERAAVINIKQRGLDLSGTAAIAIADATPGQILAQDPNANAGASTPNVTVLVAQEPSPPAYVTPNFIGESIATVADVLKDAGFTLGRITFQQPTTAANAAAAALNQPGSSSPAFQSQSYAPMGSANTPNSTSIVIAQDPPAGAKIVAGSAINFVVK